MPEMLPTVIVLHKQTHAVVHSSSNNERKRKMAIRVQLIEIQSSFVAYLYSVVEKYVNGIIFNNTVPANLEERQNSSSNGTDCQSTQKSWYKSIHNKFQNDRIGF